MSADYKLADYFLKRKTFFFVLIILINIIVYFPSFSHLPRSDQDFFFVETAETQGLGDLISQTYSYNRTRVFGQGDQILFRPLLFGLLSVEKWLFGYHFIFWQIFSIGLHLIVIWHLLKILLKIFPNGFAIIISLGFSVLHVSQELVIWQHLNGYLIALICLLKALYEFIEYIEGGWQERRKVWMVAMWLILMSLFYEFGLICAFLFAMSVSLRLPWQSNLPAGQGGAKRRSNLSYDKRLLRPIGLAMTKETGILFLPIAIYLAWSVSDYIYRVDALFSAAQTISWLFVLKSFVKIFCIAWIGPFIPYLLNYEVYERLYMGIFDKNILAYSSFGNCLLVVNMALIVALAVMANRLKSVQVEFTTQNQVGDYRRVISVVSFLMGIGYIAMITLGRVTQRGEWYFQYQSYHYYPIILLFLLSAYSALSLWGHQLKGFIERNFIVILIISGGFIILNGVKNFQLNEQVRVHSEHFAHKQIVDWDIYYRMKKNAVLGTMAAEKGDYVLALEHYGKALHISPQFSEVYLNRGVVHDQLKQYDDALGDFSQAIILDPGSSLAFFNRGIVYANTGQVDLALGDYSAALQLEPKLYTALNNRALVYERMGRFDLALADYHQAIALNSKFIPAYLNRASLYIKQKDFDLAMEDIHRILAMDPDNAQAKQRRDLINAYRSKMNNGVIPSTNDVYETK